MARMSERAQMLLVGALIIAVLFLSLSVILNASIQSTTTAAIASEDVSTSDSVRVKQNLRSDVAHLLERAHHFENDDWAVQKSYVEDNVTVLQSRYAAYYQQEGRVVKVSHQDHEEGTRIIHSGGDFRYDRYRTDEDNDGDIDADDNDDPDSEWYPVLDPTRVRQFRIDPSNVLATSDISAFHIQIVDGIDDWDIFIYDDGVLNVDVEDPSGTTETCTAPSDSEINITNATVNGQPCQALDFFEQAGDGFTVRFSRAGQIEGDFSLMVADDNPRYDANPPTQRDQLYSTTVRLNHRSSDIDYVTDIRVAPGEPE